MVAAVVGVSLAAWGYWKLWQSAPNTEKLANAPAVTVFSDRRPLAEFILVDDANNIFDLKSLNEKWSFLFFGFMYCPDICPTTIYNLSQLKREILAQGISEADVQFVFISVDPARDKAAQIQRYVRYFDPTFLGVTGSIGQLTNLTRQLGAPFRAEPETAANVYEVSHSSAIYLIDPFTQYAGLVTPPFVPSDVATQFISLHSTRGHNDVALSR